MKHRLLDIYWCVFKRIRKKYNWFWKEKKTLPLTKEEFKSHQDAKLCYVRECRKIIRKIRDPCYHTGKYRCTVHSICNLKFKVSNEILIIFHNISNYNYHFYYKRISNTFEWKFEYLGENTEKYIFFSIPIEKSVTKADKDGYRSIVTISFKITFIDLYQLHYQILLIISQKKFTKLNVKIVIAFLDMEVLRKI